MDVYDGLTVRDSKILNNSNSEIWAKTNTLIFVYKRLNVSKPSSVLVIKYDAIGKFFFIIIITYLCQFTLFNIILHFEELKVCIYVHSFLINNNAVYQIIHCKVRQGRTFSLFKSFLIFEN